MSRFGEIVVLSLLLSACANAPTPSSQVAASRGHRHGSSTVIMERE